MADVWYVDLELDRLFREAIDEDTGMLMIDADEFQARYEELMQKRESTLEETALSCKNDLAMIDAIEAEIERLKGRAEGKKISADRKKKLLERYCDGKGFETARVAVKFRPSDRVIIGDEEAFVKWADEWGNNDLVIHKEVITDKPNKPAIKKWLKSGGECEYASLQKYVNASIV